MPSSLAPVPVEDLDREEGDEEHQEVDPENGDGDDLPVSTEYVSDDSDSESAQIQDPEDASATRAALNTEFD